MAYRDNFGPKDDISVYFLIPGHAKNICDSSFGHLKRALTKMNVITHAQMMNLISSISKTTVRMLSISVTYTLWKTLSEWLEPPKAMRINSLYVFHFRKSQPDYVTAQELSNSTNGTVFKLFKGRNLTAEVRSHIRNFVAHQPMQVPITKLDNVPSSKNENRKKLLPSRYSG